MRPGRIALSAALLAATLLVPPRAVAESDNNVIATVGDAKLTVADVQRRLRHVPSFQLKTYGKTPGEIRENFVKKVMIPEVLYAQEARRRKLDEIPKVATRIRGALRSTMIKALEVEVQKKDPIAPEQIRIYYRAHKAEFNTPRRIRIWRILVADKAAAEKILEQVKGTEGLQRWSKLARLESQDKATSMRNGNLGFVRPDGRTGTPRVRVDPALFAAANKVKDGQVVPEPVAEGKQWAVVWRRGSMPAVQRTLEDESSSIRHVLWRKRMEAASSGLVAKLEKEHVSGRNDKLLQYVDVSDVGDVGTRERPGLLPRRHPRASSVPKPSEHGLR